MSMPKENVLDVLIYLFENYMFEDHENDPDQETLARELHKAGFEHSMIDRAFDWMESLERLCLEHSSRPTAPYQDAVRHYTAEEREYFSVEARGLLLNLEQCGVLDGAAREMVIDQFMALGADNSDLEHLKWVILMVLSNYAGGDGVSDLTESLVLDGLHTCIH